MASAADGKVVIDTHLDNKGFTKGLSNLKGQLGGLRSVVGRLGTAIASAFAVRALVNFGRECVELGSNVAEVQNVVDTAFGDMAYKVEAFADSAIQNFGMSRLAAKKTASTYMAMAKGMGISDDAASDMSITLAGLTGDIASFYNISQELADIKLKSVFTGETETLKDLGVVMTQDNLKAYALSQGITKSYEAMSQAEKVALRYNFVLDSLSLASGDFARTSDSWANQTRILSMQWQEFMSIMGQALITVLTPCVKLLNQIVSGLISMANTFNAVIASIFGGQNAQIQQTAESAAGVGDAISGAVDEQNALTDATKETAKAQKGALAGFDEINKLGSSGGTSASSDASVTPVTPGGAASYEVDVAMTPGSERILSFFSEVSAAIQPIAEKLRNTLGPAISEVSAGVGSIKDAFVMVWRDISTLGTPTQGWLSTVPLEQFVLACGLIIGGLLATSGMVFSDLWSLVIFPAVSQWTTDIGPMLSDFGAQFLVALSVLFAEVKGLFDQLWLEAAVPALAIISDIWTDLWAGMVSAWETHGAPVFEGIRTAFQTTADLLQNLWETVAKPVWDTIMTVVDELWNAHLKPLWDNLMDFVGYLMTAALEIYNGFIAPVVDWFINAFGPPIAGALGWIIAVVGDLLGSVVDAASSIVSALKGVVDFIVGVLTGDWERALNGLKEAFRGVANGIIGLVEGLANLVVDGLNGLIGILNGLIAKVAELLIFFGLLEDSGDKTPSIPLMKGFTLPRLATGAVIPPNREFLAVLGDQKSGTNVEAPLSTIEQAVENVLNRRGSTGGEQTIILECDKVQFAKLIYKLNQSESKRHGVSLAGGIV